jgi:hypothetical protein
VQALDLLDGEGVAVLFRVQAGLVEDFVSDPVTDSCVGGRDVSKNGLSMGRILASFQEDLPEIFA